MSSWILHWVVKRANSFVSSRSNIGLTKILAMKQVGSLSRFVSFVCICLWSWFLIFYVCLFFYLAMPSLSYGRWNVVPWSDIKPRFLPLWVWSLNDWTTREVPTVIIISDSNLCTYWHGKDLKHAKNKANYKHFTYSMNPFLYKIYIHVCVYMYRKEPEKKYTKY